ncbi:MAG: hypothetical protein A3J69_01200 [Candidatus Levybacteria bacterium RIFCSPHIGHO2_02_FULL_42_12]|nr:MAG: hypothetical protein A3J69_01200 [Candidatus Levybacteria bacterium RIFCSPHIGHO2_02_FULL_42_12]
MGKKKISDKEKYKDDLLELDIPNVGKQEEKMYIREFKRIDKDVDTEMKKYDKGNLFYKLWWRLKFAIKMGKIFAELDN